MGKFGLDLKSKLAIRGNRDQEDDRLRRQLRQVEQRYQDLLDDDDYRRSSRGRKEFNKVSGQRRALYKQIHGCLPAREEPQFRLSLSGIDEIKMGRA